MKYWVYKESRILGPFEKEAVSGLPGLDAGTLVCAGDPAGGSWAPAGEVADLKGVPAGLTGVIDDFPSSAGLLDQLQIDSAGLVSDDEFIASFAEDLFQDAAFKKDFKDILTTRIMPDENEARRARDKISELTAQLEAMYRHVSSLEAGQADLSRRLALKDLELRARGGADAFLPSSVESPAEPTAPAKTFLSPLPPPIPGGPPPVAAVADAPPPSIEWPQAPVVGAGFPSFAPEAAVPPPAPPALPEMPSFSPTTPSDSPQANRPPAEELELTPPPPQPPAPAPAEKPWSVPKPKSFKIVPTKKSFKVLGADEASPVVDPNPVPEFSLEPVVETPPPVDSPKVNQLSEVIPPPVLPPPTPAPIALEPVMPTFAPPPPSPAPVSIFPTPEAAPIMNPFTAPPPPTPVGPPPNTLSRSQPVPDFNAAFSDATAQAEPPATMARSAGAEAGAAARFAKPEPSPPTGEIRKPARNNKPFLIGGGVLLILLIVLGVIFMRQPKDDLKQMTTLDDGKAPIGVTTDDGAAAPPPIVKPKIAEPPPVPAGPSAEHLAAIELVKDFPLDGGRGTVGRWLQYSYTASPDAGTEEWNASSTGEGTVLVEYRLVPSASGGKGALYLFEADANGLVKGKNIEARQMLAGGAPAEAPKAKKKPVKKTPTRRRPVSEEPKEVPLLPLPDSGELRPPAEDDGTFGSDTINSGI